MKRKKGQLTGHCVVLSVAVEDGRGGGGRSVVGVVLRRQKTLHFPLRPSPVVALPRFERRTRRNFRIEPSLWNELFEF